MRVEFHDFESRFKVSLEEANSKVPVDRIADADKIELHLMGVQKCSFAEATEQLFVDEEHAFVVIDVAVHPKHRGWFFARPSGHSPEPWSAIEGRALGAPFNVMAPAI